MYTYITINTLNTSKHYPKKNVHVIVYGALVQQENSSTRFAWGVSVKIQTSTESELEPQGIIDEQVTTVSSVAPECPALRLGARQVRLGAQLLPRDAVQDALSVFVPGRLRLRDVQPVALLHELQRKAALARRLDLRRFHLVRQALREELRLAVLHGREVEEELLALDHTRLLEAAPDASRISADASRPLLSASTEASSPMAAVVLPSLRAARTSSA